MSSNENREEGWDIFETDIRGVEIQMDDELDIFESDIEAVAYVATHACQGSTRHLDAIIQIHNTNKTNAKFKK